VELQPWNILVSIVEPGNVITPIWEKSRAATDEIMKNFPPEAHNRYGLAMAALRKATVKRGETGVSADVVAKVVSHALMAKRPKTRYFVGRRKTRFRVALFSFLPDWLRDWLVIRQMHRLKDT
jgi:short-subunit dehydrogenase